MSYMVQFCFGRGPERSMKDSMRDFIMNCTYLCLFSFPLFCTFSHINLVLLFNLSWFFFLLYFCMPSSFYTNLSPSFLLFIHTFSVNSTLILSILLCGGTSFLLIALSFLLPLPFIIFLLLCSCCCRL